MRSKHVQGGGQKKTKRDWWKKYRTSRQSSEAHLPTFQLRSRPCQPFFRQPPQNPQPAHSRGTARAYRRTQRVYVHHRGQRPGAYHHISAYHRRHPKRVDQLFGTKGNKCQYSLWPLADHGTSTAVNRRAERHRRDHRSDRTSAAAGARRRRQPLVPRH